jgi:hypothetical protein
MLNITGRSDCYKEVMDSVSEFSNFFKTVQEYHFQMSRSAVYNRNYQASQVASRPPIVREERATNDEAVRNRLQQMMKDNSLTKLPLHELAAGIVRTSLYPHQKQALYWMLSRELENFDELQGRDSIPFIYETKVDRQGRKFFFNVITEKAVYETPTLSLGGILADDASFPSFFISFCNLMGILDGFGENINHDFSNL